MGIFAYFRQYLAMSKMSDQNFLRFQKAEKCWVLSLCWVKTSRQLVLKQLVDPPPPSHPRPPVFESVEKMLYLIIYFQHSPYFAYCELQALNLIAGKFWAMPVNVYLYLLTVLDGSNTSSIKQIFLLKLQVMFNLPEQWYDWQIHQD